MVDFPEQGSPVSQTVKPVLSTRGRYHRTRIRSRSGAEPAQSHQSAGLLEKPGALTLEERRQMEEHAAIGERILANVDNYAEIARIVRHHHERVDGLGYPDGLSREEIPLAARIISVADAYNAMTSDRPYRKGMAPEEALG